MQNFFPAFFCFLCLIGLAVCGVATGLGLIDPLFGVTAIICIVFAMVSVSADITE